MNCCRIIRLIRVYYNAYRSDYPLTSARQPQIDLAANDGDDDHIGVLITNLGTPDAPTRAAVRRYLAEFLWDPRVVELPRPLWWFILHLAVLTTRPRRTAHAYQQIWGEDGSPLLAVSRKQRRKLASRLSELSADTHPQVTVELGMRYGSPSIADALGKLRAAGARRVLVLPLYPQYCAATTASAFDAVCAVLSQRRWRELPALRFITHYHTHPGYIAALANSVRDYRQAHADDALLLMSFHGIPRASVEAGDPYYRHCEQTARLLADRLGLAEHQWRLCFQSRFGRQEWLQPYTDDTLVELARAGVGKVQVICPGFSADCLETLEEVALTNRDIFLRAGGRDYGYIPCLNARDDHIDALVSLINDNLAGWDGGERAAGASAG